LAGSEEAEDEGQWKLYFKLYCFLDVESMPKEGVEFAFMFEQAHEETLQHLAALRLQFLFGDKAKVPGLWKTSTLWVAYATASSSSPRWEQPQDRPNSGASEDQLPGRDPATGTEDRLNEEAAHGGGADVGDVDKGETSATRASIVEKWSRHTGVDQHQAMLKYMTIIKEWPGYGSTLFDVECKEGGFPHDLWLSPCTYKITVDEREMLFETPQVGEITKIMKAYINMIVKKRCSVKSVSSYGTNWIR
ncbi:hypothetical protein KUCAC02_010218, partial [Chaenocephalus aceratus]